MLAISFGQSSCFNHCRRYSIWVKRCHINCRKVIGLVLTTVDCIVSRYNLVLQPLNSGQFSVLNISLKNEKSVSCARFLETAILARPLTQISLEGLSLGHIRLIWSPIMPNLQFILHFLGHCRSSDTLNYVWLTNIVLINKHRPCH